MTPDEHPFIDKHPGFANIIIGSGFSGTFTSIFGCGVTCTVHTLFHCGGLKVNDDCVCNVAVGALHLLTGMLFSAVRVMSSNDDIAYHLFAMTLFMNCLCY